MMHLTIKGQSTPCLCIIYIKHGQFSLNNFELYYCKWKKRKMPYSGVHPFHQTSSSQRAALVFTLETLELICLCSTSFKFPHSNYNTKSYPEKDAHTHTRDITGWRNTRTRHTSCRKKWTNLWHCHHFTNLDLRPCVYFPKVLCIYTFRQSSSTGTQNTHKTHTLHSLFNAALSTTTFNDLMCGGVADEGLHIHAPVHSSPLNASSTLEKQAAKGAENCMRKWLWCVGNYRASSHTLAMFEHVTMCVCVCGCDTTLDYMGVCVCVNIFYTTKIVLKHTRELWTIWKSFPVILTSAKVRMCRVFRFCFGRLGWIQKHTPLIHHHRPILIYGTS